MLKKKEKLEQMRELGRGGLSKGLHFLRSAAINSSLENNDASASNGESEGGGKETQTTTTTTRMTYEELLALSMKLTRQNKLMKVQYQKNQNKLVAAETSDVDIQTLRGFLEHEVGLDVNACVKKTSTGSGGSIDIEVLKEKYHNLLKLQQQEQYETKPPVAVESVNLLELSPVRTTATKKKYEEIDLLGDTVHYNLQTKELDEVMKQVERMSEQMRQGAEYTKELERKLVESDEQQDELVRKVLEEEKIKWEQQEQVWREKWEEQTKLVDELQGKQNQEKEVKRNDELEGEMARLVEVKRELEMTVTEMSEQLHAGVKQKEVEEKKTADLLAKFEQDKADLVKQLEQAEAAVSATSKIATEVENGVMEKMQAVLETQRADLEAAKAENESLREQIQTLQEVSPTIAISEDEVKEKVATALLAQQSELEATKAKNATLQERVQALEEASSSASVLADEVAEKVAMALEAQQCELEMVKNENSCLRDEIETLHQTTSILTSETKDEDANGIIDSLRAEVNRLQGMLEVKESNRIDLQQELAVLKEQTQKLQRELCQKDSSNMAEAALMEKLEQVKLESAERAHEIHSLQEKLDATKEHLAKANSEGEATQSLVEALKNDTSRLADEVAQFEQKQMASEREIFVLTKVKRELEEQQEHARDAKLTMEKQLEEERAYWASKLENLIRDTDTAKRQTEKLEAELREKEKQVTKMAASQASMTSELLELQKQATSMREDLSMAAESLEAHARKAESNERRYIQSEKEATELKKQLDKTRKEHYANFEMLRQEKKAELERVHSERRAVINEKKELSRERDELQTWCKELKRDLKLARKHEEELEASLSDNTSQVGNLSADLADTKKSLSDRMALATRLQTENMDMAGKLAEQVALIEGALRDAANSKTAQSEMENQLQVAKADVRRMKQSEAKAKHDLENVQHELVKKDESFQLEREKAKDALQDAVKSEKERFKRELERVEAESKHKSKLALQAVLQKEKEIARLSARLHELEEDVRLGGADNRKILEFAQLQAKRDVEARAQTAQMQALAEQLEEAHRELQELRENKHRHAEELTAMLQNQRRDGVNMEYLKNVVVQYMSFPPGSSQQARLVPVLSTLLQFTAGDVKEIKHAARRSNGWASWGSSDASIDYKPIVVGTSHRHPMAPASSASAQGSPLAQMTSASAPRESPPKSPRASSFFLPNDGDSEAAGPSAESAEF
ncbi:unnamed protein product [Peronospora belbahrii]|uniref:GRIP domain-containing protein n=1 Tax=Peronospora belbahrii TaxID=622444 RepID=A0AAU9L9U1_9STRA|nr:unnamed protein product [Peronospora belbahrii]CAH0519119.1 unnamed protein product [Peronospora belbahrii]